jgi:predicted TIM-barrel fold metal-dependent hydrolase
MGSDEDAGVAVEAVTTYDSLHHVWDAGVHAGHPVPRPAYLIPELEADLATAPQVTKTMYVQAYNHYWTSGPTELRPAGETEWVTKLTAPYRDRIAAGIVGFADLQLGADIERVVAAHREVCDGRFVGIRHSGSWDSDPEIPNTGSAPEGLLRMDSTAEAARRLGEIGVVCETLVYFHQLPEVAALAAACPETTVVLDHTGGLTYRGRHGLDRERTDAEWRAGLEAVAACPNVYLKLGGMLNSHLAEWKLAADADGKVVLDDLGVTLQLTSEGLPRETLAAPAAAALWRDTIRWCIATFGPQRCLFESNFPGNGRIASYQATWGAFNLIVADMSEADRLRLFSGTTAAVYGI